MAPLYKCSSPSGYITICFTPKPVCYYSTWCSTSYTKHCWLILHEINEIDKFSAIRGNPNKLIGSIKKKCLLYLSWLLYYLLCQLDVLKPMVNFQPDDSRLPSTMVHLHKFYLNEKCQQWKMMTVILKSLAVKRE